MTQTENQLNIYEKIHELSQQRVMVINQYEFDTLTEPIGTIAICTDTNKTFLMTDSSWVEIMHSTNSNDDVKSKKVIECKGCAQQVILDKEICECEYCGRKYSRSDYNA